MNTAEIFAINPHSHKPTGDADLLALWRSLPTPEGWTMNEVIVRYGRLVQARNALHIGFDLGSGDDFSAKVLYNWKGEIVDIAAVPLPDEAGSKKALLGRIAELEQDLATMNKRFSDLQGKIMSGVTV